MLGTFLTSSEQGAVLPRPPRSFFQKHKRTLVRNVLNLVFIRADNLQTLPKD